MPAQQRRTPSAHAHTGVVQAAKEWATTVDAAACRSDVAMTDDAKAS